MDNKRVKVLDSMRVVAILMVFVHHYYSSFVFPEMGETFHSGALGVSLFFIISGFVIALTLERTKDFKTYIKNRFIRLSPAMLICSSITFCFFYFFYTGEGYYNSKNFYNYLIANTFIDPHIFDLASGKIKYYYLDNAYWSLWIEVCFYTLIGLLFYFKKEKHILYFVLICAIGLPLQTIFYSESLRPHLLNYFSVEQLDYFRLIARCFSLFYECLWFIIGLFLLRLHSTKERKYLYAILLVLVLCVLKERSVETLIFIIFVLMFILTFVYKPNYIKFLEHPLLLKIGTASYCMYLIHYSLGVVFIKYLNSFGLGYFSPIITIILVILFGLFCYEFLEKKLIKLYKKVL